MVHYLKFKMEQAVRFISAADIGPLWVGAQRGGTAPWLMQKTQGGGKNLN